MTIEFKVKLASSISIMMARDIAEEIEELITNNDNNPPYNEIDEIDYEIKDNEIEDNE